MFVRLDLDRLGELLDRQVEQSICLFAGLGFCLSQQIDTPVGKRPVHVRLDLDCLGVLLVRQVEQPIRLCDAQIANFTVGETKGFATKAFNSGAVSMTFDNGASTITAAAGTFRYPDGSNLSVGAEIVISGTASNNATFQIASVSADGSTVTLTAAPTTEGPVTATATARTILTFADANPDTVTAPAGTFTDAAGNLLGAGTQITFSNTISNNTTYTIATVSADGSKATFIAGDTVTAEIAHEPDDPV